MPTQTGKFELNMEGMLEAWGPADATCELRQFESVLTDVLEEVGVEALS